MKTNIVVEYVCSGNHGRSPIAAAVARQHVRKLLAEDYLEIQSSGTCVDKIKSSAFPTSLLLPCIEKALTSGLFTEFNDARIMKLARETLDTKGADEIALKTIIARMADFEECYRNIVISELIHPETSLGSVKSHIPRQLVVSDDAGCILVMGARNKSEVCEIYAITNPAPLIATIGEFAGHPDIQIPDVFGGTLQEYRDMAETLKPLVTISVEKALNMRKTKSGILI